MPGIENQKILLALWKEAGRHANLRDTLPQVIYAVRSKLPLCGLRLYELTQEDRDLQLLFEWQSRTGLRQTHELCGFHAKDIQNLKQWAQNAQALVCKQSNWPSPFVKLPHFQAADVGLFLFPYQIEKVFRGFIIFGTEGTEFSNSDVNLLHHLLEPLISMIENDNRLREIQQLKDAAEADRQSLLNRLGRNSLSEQVIGLDGGLRAVMKRVTQAAPTEVSILILGETGSGKEVIARTIHEHSLRCKGPFLRVNCGALPPELIDSELFGHEKGSFTGATSTRRGWFERANGGTIFLDEIGELPLAAQVRLLRVLQDGLLQKVGSESDINVDVRVIAATHRDLQKMVRTGDFREDLWYRIAVFPIILPSLREHLEDIPSLAEHFVTRAAIRMGIPTPPLSKQDIEQLENYSWPGNVRELNSVLERAVILGNGHYLDLDSALGSHFARPETLEKVQTGRATPSPAPTEDSLDSVIIAHLKQSLTETRGRVEGAHGAAHRLGVNPNTLRAKLKKYGINPAMYRQVAAVTLTSST
ncbi:sigma-54 dependent transcriptional regulator [Deltaproteobacteria bacterium TL4]